MPTTLFRRQEKRRRPHLTLEGSNPTSWRRYGASILEQQVLNGAPGPRNGVTFRGLGFECEHCCMVVIQHSVQGSGTNLPRLRFISSTNVLIDHSKVVCSTYESHSRHGCFLMLFSIMFNCSVEVPSHVIISQTINSRSRLASFPLVSHHTDHYSLVFSIRYWAIFLTAVMQLQQTTANTEVQVSLYGLSSDTGLIVH